MPINLGKNGKNRYAEKVVIVLYHTMKAVILVAGDGTRMRPLTLTKPKALLETAGKPLIYHIVSRLPKAVDEIVLVVGYLGRQIMDYCGNEFMGKKMKYVWQEKKLGTYHALKICEPLIEKDEKFFMLFGDDIHGKEGLEECLEYGAALLVQEVNNPERFGVVTLNEDKSVAEFIEKPENPPTSLASTGAMLLDAKVFEHEADMHSNGEYYLTTSIAKMIKTGHKIYAVKSSMWLPIGYPEDLKKAEEMLGRD